MIIFRFEQWQHSMTDISVALRPPCWCPSEGQEHSASIQSSINLGETLFRITREWKTPTYLNLGEVVCLSIIHQNGYVFYFQCQPPICDLSGWSLRIFWYRLASTGFSLAPFHLFFFQKFCRLSPPCKKTRDPLPWHFAATNRTK